MHQVQTAHRLTSRVPRAMLLAVLCIAAIPLSAFGQSDRFLGKEDILVYGLGLRVEPVTQTVPKDIATIVSTYLQAPQTPQGLPPFAPDAVVKGTLRGPGLTGPLDLSVQPNSPFNIPPLTVAGVYTLENIRLESQGAVLLRSNPESVTITVIDKLLVTQITVHALSAAEIREKGIVFDSSNFQAYNFTAAFAVAEGGNPVNINFPVVLPALQTASDVTTATVAIGSIPTPSLASLKTIVPDTLKIATQIPNLAVVGFTLNAPVLNGQDLIVPAIPGVIVIPGDIGFLDQYFSVMLMVGNAAPAGSNLSVTNLTAEIILPPGNDHVVNSADDPLRMATTARGEAPRMQPVVQAGSDGQLGTADDIATLGPGESGNAEFLVEGRREGSHTIEMSIAGTLLGLPVGPVAITGRAIGAVLVRNPTFTLTFTHPETVVSGEPYSLDVTVTNTSSSPANFVSVNLFGPNVSGATVVGEPSRQIETIPAGDSATVSFDLVARLTGKVTAATLDSDENVAGRFQLKTAVGADGVPLSPDSLVLPKEASALPKSLRDAALGLLGKAWAVATAPAGALPKGVARFSKQIVLDRAVEVAEAGFRVSLHESTPDSAAQLLMDFVGSNFARIADLYPAADQSFQQDNFTGFDALRRSSVRGDVFAAAVANLLAPDLVSNGAAAFHRALATQWGYRPGFISVLLSSSSGPASFDVAIVDAQGRRVGGTDASGKFVKEIPFSDVLAFTDGGGQRVATMLMLAAPDRGAYTVRLTRVPGTPADATSILSILSPTADGNGDVRQLVFGGVTAATAPSYTPADADPVRFTFQVIGDDVAAAPSPVAGAVIVVPDASPTVVGVVQQAQADTVRCDPESVGFPLGRIVAVLFSEEVTAGSVQDRLAASQVTAFAPEGNQAVGVALQPGRRIALVAMRDPFGPYIPRTMTVAGVEDLRHHTLTTWSGPMEATIGTNGAVVSGRVIQSDGTALSGGNVRLFSVLACDTGEVKVGVSSKYTDSAGLYSWDFVNSDMRAAITAIDPSTEEWRSIPFDISRPGQRLNVDIVLLGRGTFTGRVLAPDGRTPLAGSQLRVTSLTDNSQYGATTDGQGAFVIPRIPVGNIFVEAVNVAAAAHYNFSEYIPLAGATVSRDIVLVPADSQQQRSIKYASLSGHVLKSDGATPVAAAPVVAYYQSGSQPGVNCPASQDAFGDLAIPPECAVGVATSGVDGAFVLDQLPAGNYRLYAFDQPSLAQGEVRYTLPEGPSTVTILLAGGLATVRGVVLDSAGARVPGARVGGGLTLSTADANGAFELTDVPIGRRTIVAVSDALGVTGSATVDIVSAGEVVNVTIVLPAAGSIAGHVTLADGATPAAGVAVYVFQKVEGGYDVLGQATTDGAGAYRIDRILPDQYLVSAFAGDFSDGNVVPAVLRYDKQVLRADIRFRGAGGRVSGTVFDSDGNTPLMARVGVSGVRVRIAGGKLGVGFEPVSNFAIVDTGLDGKFSFAGLFVGDFVLRAVGQFGPDPIESPGRIDTPGQRLTVDLRLQATSQVAGVVYQPDGVTPASNVNVTFKSDAFRIVCSGGMDAEGDPDCDVVPQGIQSEYAVSDGTGRFLVPLVNAGAFTLSFEDPTTGKVAQVHGSVRPGARAEIAARLLGRGVLTIHALASDGHTPIPGARVDVQQTGFPNTSLTMFADAQGVLVLSGGDALTEGEATVLVRDVRNGFAGRGSATITHDDEEVSLNVYIFDAWGTVSGTVFKSDGVTPVPNAEVVISVAGKGVGYIVTDASGAYTLDTVPLGPFSVDVFEAATSRIGYGSGSIDFNQQRVTVNVTEVAIGLVTGTAIDASVMAPLAGWSVSLAPTLASGRSLPPLSGMTAADGTFSFPGVSKGVFTLTVIKEGASGTGRATGEIYTEGQRLDIPILVQIVHPLYGSIDGVVRNPDGTPAAYATVSITYGPDTVAAADGSFSFPQLQLGRYQVNAKAQASSNAGSVWAALEFNGDLVQITIPMVGLTAVHGQAVYADNSPASGVQVTFIGLPASGCDAGCTKYADANGEFSFTQLPARTFTLWASDPVRSLKGSVGGPLNPGEDKALRVVLQPSALAQGRILSAGGRPAAGITCELKVGEQDLFIGTDGDGRFSYPAAPLGAYTLDFSDPIGQGIARKAGTLTGDLDFGDILLDEAPPQVANLTPAASATRVPLAQIVTAVFSEPIDPAGVTASGISLTGPTGVVTGVLALGGGDTTVTFTPLAPLKDEARYTLTFVGIKDRLGKVMPDYTASFTTVDITPPSAIDVSPAQFSSGVPIYTPIRIKYSEPLDPTAWGTSPLALSLNGVAMTGRLDYLYGNTVIAFTPALPLGDGATYRVRLAAATDLSGNVQAQGLDFTFSTTDRTPPQIASLAALTGPTVIENTVARVRPDVGSAFDVAVVDYYLNGTVAGSSRSAPFDFAFQAIPALGRPGDTIAVTAIATDTSGNRGTITSPLIVTVTPDQPPAIAITEPTDGSAYRNGARVTVSLHATDDVGLVTLGYKAQTGKPQDAGTINVVPPATDKTASFTFDVPLDAIPGSAIQIQASGVDSKGQATPAAPVSFTVLDAVAPVATVSGSASGDKVMSGQTVTVTLNASDAGGLKQVRFAATGLATFSETRPIPGAPTSMVTAFTFTVSPTATTGDTVLLDATATDMADNVGTAARVVLTVSDVTPPTITLRTASGGTAVLPGETVDLVAQAADDQAVSRIDLTGQGAFTVSDSRQVSPPSNGATVHFSVTIPASAQPGAVLTLTARATDVAGNTSGPAIFVLSIGSALDVTMPPSIVVLAGETKDVTVQTLVPAPAGGLVISFATGDSSIAFTPASITIPENQSEGTITVTAVSGGTTPLKAYVQGALRATSTVAVQGGVVSGYVFDDLLTPIAGAEVTVGGSLFATTDQDGFYQVTGAVGAWDLSVSMKAIDPATHKRGSATARLNRAGGYVKNVNVVLIAAGGVRGSVFAADGVTPAGSGVQIDIYDQADLSHALNTTFTDADSRFEFPVVTEGAYVVDARSTGGSRGRATAMVASGQDVTADISYLGVGTVTGMVKDGSSNPVPNAQVVLNASSVFGNAPVTTIAAEPDGTFSFPSVFVGSFWIRATDSRTGQAGVASGVVGHDQETVPVEVVVASYGSLQGTVYRSDGTTTVANAQVTATQEYTYLWATTDSNGHYQMPVVPLGTYEMAVFESATRGVGNATATIAASGEAKTVDLTLQPQGTVVVTVVDANSQVVAGAAVTVKAVNGSYNDTLGGLTGADGIAVINHVLAGNLAIRAEYRGLSGQTTSSVAGGATATVTVQLQPVGSIAGIVLMPDGQTPAAGSVKLVDDPGFRQATLAADGSYRLDGLPLAVYKVAGYDQTGRFRAVSPSISLTTPGQVGTANLTFVGLGIVSGRVLNIDSSSAGNTAVQVRSLNPTFGGYWSTRTDAAGYYQVSGVTVGPISVVAGDVSQGIFAEATGTLGGDGQTLVVDLLLKNNSTYFPVSFRDANGMPFTVAADGTFTTDNWFITGNKGGLKLELETGGVTTPFTGAEIGTLEAGGRGVAARQQGLAGLDVTRRVFVPTDGYFARYVDTITNPGASPVSVNVWVTSYVNLSTLAATSSGDATLDVSDAATADRWFAVDSGSSSSQVGVFVFDGPGGVQRAGTAAFAPSNSAVWRWDNVTVPPGGSVAFLYFVAQQVSRPSAQATAARLVQLPPEALASLRQDDLAAVRNFAVPSDGVSTVAALPSLTGVVTGQVVEADTLTPVPWSQVAYTSNNPYFAWTRRVNADASGLFRFETNLTGNSDSMVVPVDAFSLVATYPSSGISSPLVVGNFPAGQSLSTQNIVFTTTAGVSGSVRRANGTVVTSGSVAASGTWNGSNYTRYATIASDGSFSFSGQPPIAFTLTASVPHPQGSANTGTESVTLSAGQSQIVFISLQPTGTVQGSVRTGGGTAAANVTVHLASGSFTRGMATDTSGAFTLTDVPAGSYSLSVTDPTSGLTTTATVAVAADQATTEDLQFVSVGIVRGTVRDGSNAVAANASVALVSSVTSQGTLRTTTNASGAYQIAGVPLGPFTVSATSAGLDQYGETTGTVASDGQQVVADIAMVSNIISMPRTSYDANSLNYDVQQNGRIRYGYDSAFNGPSGSTQSDPYGAARLSLIAGSTETAFAGAATAFGEHGNRELAIVQQGVAGLDVTRKVYIPETGYFARYLEVLSNPGTAPVTVSVKVATDLGYMSYSYWWGYSGVVPSIKTTSNGGTVLDVSSAQSPDRWVVFDDSDPLDVFRPNMSGSSQPSTAFVFDGPGAGQRVASAAFTNPYAGLLTYQWDSVTVPAGGKVILMHFVVQQSSTTAGTASAQRLVQLPPEAVAGLSAEEASLIANFSVPADLGSTLPALPALTGTVTGQVQELDGTPVQYAQVKFVSGTPYFSRTQQVSADASGNFQFASQFTTYRNTVIPVGPFTLTATHPTTSLASAGTAGTFPEGQSTATTNVVFTNLATVTGHLRKQSGAAVSNVYVRIQSGSTSYSAATSDTGSFTIHGLPAATWTLSATLSSSQWLTATASVTTTAGQTTAGDLMFPPTGSVQGVVYNADGTAPPYAYVYIVRPSDGSSYSSYNYDGTYAFGDVPLGSYTVYATDPRTGAKTQLPVVVAQDQVTVQNITLAAAGSLQVQVNFARGEAAGGARVDVKDAGTGSYFGRSISVDAAGRGTVTPVAAGAVTVRAYHPSDSTFYAEATTTLSTEGQVVPITVTLPGVVTIKAHTAVSTGTAVPNLRTYLYQTSQMDSYMRSATTDSTGVSTLGLAASGTSYTVKTERIVPSYNSYYLTAQSSPFTPATDGDAVTAELTVPAIANSTVAVVKPDQTSFGSSIIYVKNAYRPNFQNQGYTSSSTGTVALPLPEGDYTIRVSDYNTGAALFEQSGTIQATDEGRAMTFTLTVGAASGTVTGRVFTADGVTPIASGQVSLINVMDQRTITSTTTGSDGTYTFTNVRAGTGGFIVRATMPYSANDTTAVDVPGSLPTDGATVTIDVTMPFASVTLGGTVFTADGVTPLPWADVNVLTSGGTVLWRHSTSSNGVYGPVTLWASTSGVTIRALDESGYVWVDKVQLPGASGGTFTVNLNVPILSGNLQGKVVAADGVTGVDDAYLQVLTADGKQVGSTYTNSDGTFSYTTYVPTAGATLSAYYDSDAVSDRAPVTIPIAFASPGATVTVNMTLPLSVVRGHARYADGAAVGNLNPSTVGSDSQTRGYMTSNTAAGTFVVLGTPVGPFRAYVKDRWSPYFTGFTDATVTDIAVPVDVEVVLPAKTTLKARVVDSAGQPVYGTWVALSAPGAPIIDDARTDATGLATFTAPVGPVSLQTCSNDESCVIVSGTATAGQTQTLDIAPRPTGTLQGRLFKADGVTPIVNTYVTLESYAGSGYEGYWYASPRTDATGNFTISGVPAGMIYVEVYDGTARGGIRVPVTIVAGATNTMQASGGSGGRMPTLSAGGAQFSPGDGGQLSAASLGSLYSPYYYSYELTVNDSYYYSNSNNQMLLPPGSELEYGPSNADALIVKRKLGAVANKPYVRYLETIYNPTGVPLPMSVVIDTSVNDPNAVVTPAATGNKYAITGTVGGNRPMVAHVFAGSGTPAVRAGVSFEAGSSLGYVWATVVPPGGTVEFMHFSALGDPTDTAGLQALAQSLVDLSDPDALAGLSDQEKARILNFNVPGGTAAVAGNIRGTVVMQDATTPLAGATVQAMDAVTGYTWASTTTDGLGAFQFDNVPTGEYGVALAATLAGYPGTSGGATVSFTEAGQTVSSVVLTLPTGEVTGHVTATGSAVPNPTVIVAQTDGSGTVRTLGAYQSGADGKFVVLGVAPGPFTLTVIDSEGQAGTTVQGTYDGVNALTLDVALPAAPTCLAPPAGLRGFWKGEAGAEDSVHTGNDGTLEGGALVVPARVGNGFAFDGVTGLVKIPDTRGDMRPATITVSAWVKFNSLDSAMTPQAGEQEILFKKKGTIGPKGWFEAYALAKTRLAPGDDRFAFYLNTPDEQDLFSSEVSRTQVEAGRFYHVVGTADGKVGRLYVNGILEATFPFPYAVDGGTGPLVLGGTGESGWDPRCDCVIDEVQLFDRALGADEVQAMYAATTAGLCPDVQMLPATLPVTYVGVNSTDFLRAVNGLPPVTFSAVNTPPGMTVTSEGLLTGTPTSAGSFVLDATATDGTAASATRQYTKTVQTCLDLPAGLISLWSGENDATDSLGANNGTLTGGSYGPGRVGMAFFGDSSALRMDSQTDLLTLSDTFTIEFWANPNNSRSSTSETTSGTAGTSGQRYAITPEYRDGGAGAGVSVGTNGISVFEHGSSYLPSLLVYNATISGWTHIAVVYDNKTPRLYVNGVLVRVGQTSTQPHVFASKSLGDPVSYGPYYGLLDEVALYNRALTSSEIQQIYTAAGEARCKTVVR